MVTIFQCINFFHVNENFRITYTLFLNMNGMSYVIFEFISAIMEEGQKHICAKEH